MNRALKQNRSKNTTDLIIMTRLKICEKDLNSDIGIYFIKIKQPFTTIILLFLKTAIR